MEADNRISVADPFAKRLMVRYLEHREKDLNSLRTALSQADFETIRIKGHNMYGSGSAYGLDRISELGAKLETAARKQNNADISQLIESLEAFIRNVRVV